MVLCTQTFTMPYMTEIQSINLTDVRKRVEKLKNPPKHFKDKAVRRLEVLQITASKSIYEERCECLS